MKNWTLEHSKDILIQKSIPIHWTDNLRVAGSIPALGTKDRVFAISCKGSVFLFLLNLLWCSFRVRLIIVLNQIVQSIRFFIFSASVIGTVLEGIWIY